MAKDFKVELRGYIKGRIEAYQSVLGWIDEYEDTEVKQRRMLKEAKKDVQSK